MKARTRNSADGRTDRRCGASTEAEAEAEAAAQTRASQQQTHKYFRVHIQALTQHAIEIRNQQCIEC